MRINIKKTYYINNNQIKSDKLYNKTKFLKLINLINYNNTIFIHKIRHNETHTKILIYFNINCTKYNIR